MIELRNMQQLLGYVAKLYFLELAGVTRMLALFTKQDICFMCFSVFVFYFGMKRGFFFCLFFFGFFSKREKSEE